MSVHIQPCRHDETLYTYVCGICQTLEQNVLIIIYVLHERFSGCIHLNATMLRSDRTFGGRSWLVSRARYRHRLGRAMPP